MTNQVFYLCHHSTLENGLIFPSELDEGEYGYAGFFVVEENQGELRGQYLFDAIQNSQKSTLTLKKRDNNTFVAKAEEGIFYFMAHPIKEFYVGKKCELQNHNPLWLLEPLLRNQLENACQNHNFYFVGAMD
jgi:hypothetical protein